MKTNDQIHIIKYIKEKEYVKVWEEVKFIGVKDVLDINERYLIFSKAIRSFDPYINNNFIQFYKKYLKGLRLNKNTTFIVTTTPLIIQELKNEAISPNLKPRERRKSKVDSLKKWKHLEIGRE